MDETFLTKHTARVAWRPCHCRHVEIPDRQLELCSFTFEGTLLLVAWFLLTSSRVISGCPSRTRALSTVLLTTSSESFLRETVGKRLLFSKGFFGLEKWAREIEQKPEEDIVWQDFPNPQDTVVECFRRSHPIEMRVPLAGCVDFFLQASIFRRLLTKMSGAICCMNMRFAKRSWEHPSKSAFRHSVVRVMHRK